MRPKLKLISKVTRKEYEVIKAMHKLNNKPNKSTRSKKK